MHQIIIQYWQSPAGELILGSYDEKLCLANWRYKKTHEQVNRRLQKGLKAHFVEAHSDVIAETIKQLDEYFSGKRTVFDIPLELVGTEFQKSVWQGLMQVPYGTTNSYVQLAEKISNKKAVRAVANANGANAISILIPCHRIIGSDGTLTGYAGGLEAKDKLLTLEKINT